MTPEEAYDEALRRIREAEETGAVELDLSELAFESDSSRVGPPHLAPIAQPLQVRVAERRFIPAGRANFAPEARPHLVLAPPRIGRSISSKPPESYRAAYRCDPASI
jgi:hypothetical protein